MGVDNQKEAKYNENTEPIHKRRYVTVKDIIRAIDNLPFIVKLILALPGLAVFWAVYRLFRSIDKQNVLGIVLAAVLLVAGPTFVWIVDLICLLLYGKVWWLD